MSAGRLESTIFIKIVAFPPRPKPRIPSEAANIKTVVAGEKNSIIPHPIAVKSRENVNIRLGSKRSVRGPKRMEPSDIPIYMIEIAYPEITVLSGCV